MPSTPVIAHATPLVAVPPAGEWCVSSEGRPSTAAGSRDLCILCTHIDARRVMHARAAAPVPLQCSERSICQHLPPGTASASACAGARGTAGAGAGRPPPPPPLLPPNPHALPPTPTPRTGCYLLCLSCSRHQPRQQLCRPSPQTQASHRPRRLLQPAASSPQHCPHHRHHHRRSHHHRWSQDLRIKLDLLPTAPPLARCR